MQESITHICRQWSVTQGQIFFFKLLFAVDESVLSSIICEDPAYQHQIQSQDDSHGSQEIDISVDDNVQIESEGVTKTQSKKENAGQFVSQVMF